MGIPQTHSPMWRYIYQLIDLDELCSINIFKSYKCCPDEPKIAKYGIKCYLESESVRVRGEGGCESEVEVDGMCQGDGSNGRARM